MNTALRAFRRLRIKGLLIVAVPLLFEMVFALLVMRMDGVARSEFEAEVSSKEITASAHRLLTFLVDTETGVRGFVLTAQLPFMEPYERAIKQVPVEIDRLRHLATNHGESINALERLVGPVLDFETSQRDRVLDGRRTEAAALVANGDGKRKMDAFRRGMDDFLLRHQRFEAERSAESSAASRRLRNVVLVGLSMNVVAAVAMAMFFSANITRRVRVIVENTFRLEHDEPLRAPQPGDDEIAELDARFHRMGEALAKSRRELRATNQELEAFSYSVSHDLRAPLRAVSGYAQMFAEDFASTLNDEGRRYLGAIRSEAARMAQLIDDLLAFARAGRGAIRVATIDVGAVAREALASISYDGDVSFVVLDPPPALADRALLRQVLVNLLSNAIKFSARSSHMRIEVGGSEGRSENTYWVRDEGAGFDMRYAEKLFGVFQRLHRDEEFEGTGIGLANVQRIILRHRGRVWAEGKEDHGATFYFSLPKLADSTSETLNQQT